MTPFFRIMALPIIAIFLLFPSTLTAEDEAGVEDATKAFLGIMKEVFENAKELQGKTDQEKVRYILEKGKETIQEKIKEKFKDQLKEKFLDYAKENYRAYLFRNAALGKIREIIEKKGTLDPRIWEIIDLDIRIAHASFMGQLTASIEVLEFTYDAIEIWDKKGPREGAMAIGKKIADKLGNALIPGWGTYRLAQEAVVALGNYVLEYAFDTALKGIMKDMLPHSPDSPEFSKWLLGLNDISAFVQLEWDEQYAFDPKFYLKYTDWDEEKKEFREKEGEGMKKRIIAELEKARDELKRKEAEAERLRSEITLKLREKDEAAKTAAARVGLLSERIRKEAESFLEKVEEFKLKLQGARKQEAVTAVVKARERFQKEESLTLASAPAGPTCTSVRISSSDILGALQRSVDEVRDSGVDGYEMTRMQEAYTEYQRLRRDAVAASNDAIAFCNKRYYGPMGELRNKIAQAWDDELQRFTLEVEYSALSTEKNEWSKRLEGLQGSDIAILEKEEQMALAETMERSTKMLVAITAGIEKHRGKMERATRAYLDGAEELEGEIKDKLNFPEAWRGDYYAVRIGVGDPSPNMVGDLLKEVKALQEARQHIKEDQERGAELHRREIAQLEDFLAVARDVRRDFESLVPRKLQSITEAGGTWGGCDITLGVQHFTSFMGEHIPGMLYPYDKTSPLCIPRIYGDTPNNDRFTVLKRPPLKSTETIANIDKRLASLEQFTGAEEAAISFGKIMGKISEIPYMYMNLEYDLEKEKDRAADMFRKKGNLRPTYIAPEESDGIGHLKEMKIAWEFSKGMVAKMNTLRKPISQVANYARDFQGSFAALDKWNTIPNKIVIYENALQAARKEYEGKIAGAASSVKAAREQLEALKKQQDGFGIEDQEKKVDQLAKDTVENVRWYGSFPKEWPMDARLGPIIEEWKKLDREVPAYKNVLQERKREMEARLRTQEEELKRRLEEEERKKQEEARKRQDPTQEGPAVATARLQAVRELYERFRQAYESKNDPQVMGFIGDDWQSGDGTTLSDLQVNLSRSFRTFDEIRYNLQNIQIQRRSEGVYSVSYDVTITSRIFKRNLKHEEKSSVIEEVIIDRSGKAKISKTLNGRFWYVK